MKVPKNSFLHQKYHKICKLKYCQFCDVFDEKKHSFGTFRGQNSIMGYPKNILGPKNIYFPKSWIFWASSLWIKIEVQFWFLMKNIIFLVLLGVKNPKMGYPRNILGPKKVLIPSKLDFLGQEPVNQNWGPILVFDEKYHFLVLKVQKS